MIGFFFLCSINLSMLNRNPVLRFFSVDLINFGRSSFPAALVTRETFLIKVSMSNDVRYSLSISLNIFSAISRSTEFENSPCCIKKQQKEKKVTSLSSSSGSRTGPSLLKVRGWAYLDDLGFAKYGKNARNVSFEMVFIKPI